MALYEKYGGEYCLQSVDCEAVEALMEELGGEELLKFVDDEFAAKAQSAYDSLKVKVSLTNVWHVFRAMIPLV